MWQLWSSTSIQHVDEIFQLMNVEVYSSINSTLMGTNQPTETGTAVVPLSLMDTHREIYKTIMR